MNRNWKFKKVQCNEKISPERQRRAFTEANKNGICGEVLGHISTDNPNAVIFHCKPCKKFIQYEVAGMGLITKKVLPEDLRIMDPDETVIIEG